MSKIIPNSFQTPNFYIDELLAFLTGEEYKVLSYTTRRIFGFLKRQDRISLSQYENGLLTHEGKRLDYGVGLSRPTIVKTLASLIGLGILIHVKPNDPSKNEGACYSLETDSAKINLAALHARRQTRHSQDASRTEHARKVKNSASAVNAINQPERLVALTETGKSDIPRVVNAINTQKPEEKDSRKKESKSHSAANAGGVKDSRSSHLAIQAVRAALGRYPQRPLWGKIISVLGDEPDTDKVIDCATEYAARGKYAGDVTTWLFDWYVNGIPPRGTNGNGHKSNVEKSMDAVRQYMDEERAKCQTPTET